jgi:DNA-binding NtrC family response regulator
MTVHVGTSTSRATPQGQGSAAPASLIHLHRHSLTTVLVLGGDAEQREFLARAFHRESALHSGPFVAVSCHQQLGLLMESVQAWVAAEYAHDLIPLRAAERGTLFIDAVEQLPLDAQRLLLVVAKRMNDSEGGGSAGMGPCRLIVGNEDDLGGAVAEQRFLPALFDAVDKVRVDLSSKAAR